MRKLQKEQSARYIPDSATRSRLISLIGPKVEGIRSGPVSGEFKTAKERIGGGRGAAISPDGYFLTAYHVVKGPAFFLTESTSHLTSAQSGQLKRKGFVILNAKARAKAYREKSIPGRLVWFDEASDLAIVKFAKRTPNYFRKFQFPVAKNVTVLSTDESGRSVTVPDSQGRSSLETAVGNGPFFSAGQIHTNSDYGQRPDTYTIMTSLVGRGGMSGSPLVTLGGELCGIISRVRLTLNVSDLKIWKSSRTTARMIEPATIRAIIRKDRTRR